MKKHIRAGLVAALPLLGLAPAQAAERTVVILQALTGPGAFAGVPAADGAKFAAEEINATKFLGSDTLKVIVEDDGSDRNQATTLVRKYAADPSVLAVVGPTIAPTAIPAAAAAAELKIPIVPLSNSLAVLQPGQWAFLTSQPAKVTMPLLSDYAVDKLKVKNCAMVSLSDNDAYVELSNLIRSQVEPRGVKIIDFVAVKSTETDFQAIATKIVSENPDCVFIVTNAVTGGGVLSQLKQAGLDPKTKLIGQSGLSTPDLVRLGGQAVEGIILTADWAPGGTFDRAKAFAAAFKQKTGQDADNFNAMGDSIMYVVASAIKDAGPSPTRQAVRDNLATTKDVPVVMGTGSYSRDADRIPHTGVVFLTVRNGKFVAAE